MSKGLVLNLPCGAIFSIWAGPNGLKPDGLGFPDTQTWDGPSNELKEKAKSESLLGYKVNLYGDFVNPGTNIYWCEVERNDGKDTGNNY